MWGAVPNLVPLTERYNAYKFNEECIISPSTTNARQMLLYDSNLNDRDAILRVRDPDSTHENHERQAGNRTRASAVFLIYGPPMFPFPQIKQGRFSNVAPNVLEPCFQSE